jgi:hypothetical protein
MEMQSAANGAGASRPLNPAKALFREEEKSGTAQADVFERIVHRYEDDLAKLEAKEKEMTALSQQIQADQAHLSKKKRILLLAAGLIAVGGVAATAGAAAIPALILVKAAMLGTLAGEAATLISFTNTHTREGALGSGKVGLDIRLEENEFQQSFKQRKVDYFKGMLEKVREEDKKKLAEELKNMSPESIDSLTIADEGDFVNIGGIRLRKKEEA